MTSPDARHPAGTGMPRPPGPKRTRSPCLGSALLHFVLSGLTTARSMPWWPWATTSCTTHPGGEHRPGRLPEPGRAVPTPCSSPRPAPPPGPAPGPAGAALAERPGAPLPAPGQKREICAIFLTVPPHPPARDHEHVWGKQTWPCPRSAGGPIRVLGAAPPPRSSGTWASPGRHLAIIFRPHHPGQGHAGQAANPRAAALMGIDTRG
jgi:hypothetical protein